MCDTQRPANGADSVPVPIHTPLTAEEFRGQLLDFLAFLRVAQPLYTDSYMCQQRTIDAVEVWIKAMGRRPS
jgi:hypothetical protein